MALEVTDDGEVVASRVEVAGIVKDDYGNEWTIPADEMSYDELLTDPLKLPHKDPRFHYQFVRRDQIVAKATEHFKPVTRAEVGIQDIVSSSSDTNSHESTPLDFDSAVGPYHWVHDLLCMKIPQVLADRRYAAAKRFADEAVKQIREPERLEKAGREDYRMAQSSEPFRVEASDPGLLHFPAGEAEKVRSAGPGASLKRERDYPTE